MDKLIDSLIKSRYKVNFDFSTKHKNNSDSLIEWVNTLDGNILDIYRLLKQHKASKSLTNSLVTKDATVTTDKRDYSPSETAFISGSGFALGETIRLQVLHTDGRDNTRLEHQPWEITDGVTYYDDAGNLAGDLDGIVDGNIETSWFVDPYDSANSAFQLTATGLTSGETATHHFTDSDPAVQFFYVPKKEEDIRTIDRVNNATTKVPKSIVKIPSKPINFIKIPAMKGETILATPLET